MFDLDLGVKVTLDFDQYPLHDMTYMNAPATFEVTMSNGLEGDAFYKKKKKKKTLFDV